MPESQPALQDQRFLERDWDYCLVLDACRFDRFEARYDEYLQGDLQRLRSPGSSTPEWAARTFTGTHDIAYFSGNPFVNGLGIPLNELKWGASCDYPWAAADHIETIVDVWQHGWDDDLGTIPPSSIAESFRDRRDQAERAERVVLHYMQPHAPYLDREAGGKLRTIKEGIQSQGERADEEPGLLDRVADSVRPRVESVLEDRKFLQKVGLWMELDKRSVLTDGTRDAALEQYDRNLDIVLEAVAEIVPELEGDVVVTADHGEAFGEQGIWEHHIETHIPPLVEVPWLEVEGVV